MCIKFTPFSDINSPKAIPIGAAHTSDSPYSGVIPTSPTTEPRTHKNTVSLPENFRAISYGSRLDPFGFKIKTVCFERLIEAFSLLFFKPFLARRDKILSSDYCVQTTTIRSASDANITISACNMREESSTRVFYFRVAEVPVCSHGFQIKIFYFERLIESLDSVFGNAWRNPITWPLRDIEMKSTSDAIFTFRREQNISFSLYKQGTDARRLHYLYGLLFNNKG